LRREPESRSLDGATEESGSVTANNDDLLRQTAALMKLGKITAILEVRRDDGMLL